MKPIKPPITARGFREVVYAENQPEYLPLPCLQSNRADGRVITAWQLTWRERIKLLFGSPLYLTLLTFHQPLQPILFSVGEEDLVEKESEKGLAK